MKKNFTLSQMLLVVAFIFTLNSCKKEGGCTDASANNYNSNATFDNGTCLYSAGAVFYSDMPLSGTATVSITNLNPSTANITAGVYYNSGVPTCGTSGLANFTTTLTEGNGGAVSYQYSVALAGTNGWGGTVTFNNGYCSPVLLPSGGITFYTTNINYANILPITVNIGGITSQVTNISAAQPTVCGATGCAYFGLPVMPSNSYYYTAVSASPGGNWSGNISITNDGQCNFVQLN